MLMAECKSTRDLQETLKRLFAGTIEQMLEAEMEDHPQPHEVYPLEDIKYY